MKFTKKIVFLTTVVGSLLAFASCGGKSTTEAERISEISNPLPIKFGDRFRIHSSDGKYYMYGTSLNDGFEAYVSSDLVRWER